MKYNLTLVTLNESQIEKAKEINGRRKTITHALICGPHGQIFGTETYCRKYYSVWCKIFPYIFDKSIEVCEHEISNYETTFNLVNKLIEIHDPLEKAANPVWQEIESIRENKKPKKGFISRLFGGK
ncbi:hypothetical protein [Cellvibrio sp. PSBB023]|uniref:hypothetical protein n=1 Tax=Cellvibrio sp. PSBB023 TaxID=1945512 RepID=UPI0009C1E46E|nr:hypothetical protein [Cellvibrio sp. PSBB023]AQT62337.1 hypothetical protein B0D95_08160 [Cellvibrio sp. PSBB023]